MAGIVVQTERVKLLATALNNIGLAFVIGGFVAPFIAGPVTWRQVGFGLLWFAFGSGLHLGGQAMLGRLRE